MWSFADLYAPPRVSPHLDAASLDRGRDLFLHTAVELVVFRDLLELPGAEMLIAGLRSVLAARDAVLGAASGG